jgi:hypothetical protein
MVVLDQPVTGELSPVRFVDRDGETVLRPLPEDWARAPVLDLFEPCPACGAVGWDEVRPGGRSRARSTRGGGWELTPTAVCRTCGHEEPHGGVSVGLAGGGDAPTATSSYTATSQSPEEHRREQRAVLDRVRFPVYAATGWVPQFEGHGLSDDNLVHSVTVIHRDSRPGGPVRLSVETTVVEQLFVGVPEIARTALVDALQRQLMNDKTRRRPPRSEAGLAVWFAAFLRERERFAALAERRDHNLRVDGQAKAFHVAELGSCWSAVHRRGDLLIVVTGREVPIGEVTLESLDDVAEALVGVPAPIQ